MNSNIIIISGKSGHGKDTLANILNQKLIDYGYSVAIIHYADILKFCLKQFYQWNGEKNEEGRYLLQHVGTDLVRAKDPDFWVNIVKNFIQTLGSEFEVYIIPDARFANEINIMKDSFPNVTSIRVERIEKDKMYINPILTLAQAEHESETSLDYYGAFDYYVENRSLSALNDSAELLLYDIKLFE